jgi:hypothetical protein
MKDWSGIQGPNDFRSLKGSPVDEIVNRVDELPHCFILHPAVFLDHIPSSAVDAASLAASIISATLGDSERNPPTTAESLRLANSSRLLEFLWCVEKSILAPISMEELPESEEVHQRCNEITDSLLSWSLNRKMENLPKKNPAAQKNSSQDDDQYPLSDGDSVWSEGEETQADIMTPTENPRKGKRKDPRSYEDSVEDDDRKSTTGSAQADQSPRPGDKSRRS